MNKLIILCGPPASGKSTWSKKFETENPDVIRLSSDELRAKFGTGEEDQSVSGQVFAHMKRQTENLLKSGSDVMIDAMNMSKKARKDFVEIGRKLKAHIVAYVFEVPEAELKRRNKARSRTVPDFVIDKALASYQKPETPEVDEVHFVK
jgi:predicted kinase